MKKRIVVALVFISVICLPESLRADEPDVRDLPARERVFVGGFLGLQLGTFTAININLHAGYLITNRLSAGIGGNYQYTRNAFFEETFTSHIYGGNVFTRLLIYEGFFAQAEYERLRIETGMMTGDLFDDTRTAENNYLLGAGYNLPVGERVHLNLLLLYNLNESSQAYRDNPFIRIGVDVHF